MFRGILDKLGVPQRIGWLSCAQPRAALVRELHSRYAQRNAMALWTPLSSFTRSQSRVFFPFRDMSEAKCSQPVYLQFYTAMSVRASRAGQGRAGPARAEYVRSCATEDGPGRLGRNWTIEDNRLGLGWLGSWAPWLGP